MKEKQIKEKRMSFTAFERTMKGMIQEVYSKESEYRCLSNNQKKPDYVIISDSDTYVFPYQVAFLRKDGGCDMFFTKAYPRNSEFFNSLEDLEKNSNDYSLKESRKNFIIKTADKIRAAINKSVYHYSLTSDADIIKALKAAQKMIDDFSSAEWQVKMLSNDFNTKNEC